MGSRAAAPATRGGRGAVGPGGIDASSTGNIGGDIVKAIGNQIQMNRQNAVANQILNTQNAPRAGLVAPGLNPATGAANLIRPGTPTTGTSPLTGGIGELQMRQQLQQQDLADQLQKAKIASELALTHQRQVASSPAGGLPGNRSRWLTGPQGGQAGVKGGKATKPAPYVAGSSDPQDPSSDDFGKVAADFNSTYGGGGKTNLFNKFASNLGNLQPDGKGHMIIMGPNPNFDQSKPESADNPKTAPVTGKDGLPVYSIPVKDADFWAKRYNAARIAKGMDPLGNLPDGINPNSGKPGGSDQVNPIDVPDNLTLRSLPMKTWMRLPDGSIKQKLPAGPSQQGSAQQGQPQASVDTGTDQDVAAQDQDLGAGAVPPPQLTQTNQPLPTDQNVGAGAAPQLTLASGQGPQIPNVADQGLPTTLPAQNVAAVSPQQAGQSYLDNLGLGNAAGELYPKSDLYG
jgi:hypothetical protein